MSTTQVQTQEVTPEVRPLPEQHRGLSLRSFVVAVFSLLLLGMWVEYEERFIVGGPTTENSPPNGAVAVVVILLVIGIVLYLLRRQLRLTRAEMVFIYTALLVAAPLYTQGMWTRFFGMMTAIPHEGDFKSYESEPPILWPHGDNLIANADFKKKLEGFAVTPTKAKIGWEKLEWKGSTYNCPVIDNGDSAAATTNTRLVIQLDRYADAEKKDELLVPGEKFMLNFLVKSAGLQATSSYYASIGDKENPTPLVVFRSTGNTDPTFANLDKLMRVGVTPVTIPTDLKDTLKIELGLSGPGKITLLDPQFMNITASEAAYSGIQVVRESDYNKLAPNERDLTIRKPDNMFSLAGLKYLVTGFIPWKQWAMPLFAWTVLIGALFMGFMGFNVLMRKQWVENERFTFPMNLVPRYLFGEEQDLSGKLKGLLHNKVLWIGFLITFPLVMLKGIHFYYPQVPAPLWGDMWGNPHLDAYVTNPVLKAYFANFHMCIIFSLLAITLLVETDILFSIWFGFAMFQFMYMFGKAFNFNRFVGYPWEWQQAIGSFVVFAFLAIWAGRRHLYKVFRHIFGEKTDLDDREEVVKYRTALLLIILSLLLIGAWGIWTKMGLWVSLLYFGWMLVCGFTASKIRAEAGMPYAYWTPYFGLMFVSAMGGFAIFGTTGMLVATMASGFMLVSCFLFIAPVQVESMELGRFFKVRPRDISYALYLGLLGGILLGGFTMMCWSYGKGGDNLAYSWPYGQNWYFDSYRGGELASDRTVMQAITDKKLVANKETGNYDPAKVRQVLAENKPTSPLNFVYNVDAKGIGIGVVVTLIIAMLRSTFMWFPLHPLGYVLATTYFAHVMWLTIFLSWAIRLIVLRIGGAHTIRRGLVPFCVGMFLACIVSIIIFDGVGIYLQAAHGVVEVYGQWP